MNDLVRNLPRLGLNHVDGSTVATSGLTSLTKGLSGIAKESTLQVINDALTKSWRLPIVLTCISLVGVLGIEHRKASGS